jgi:hypothetical protein
MCCKMKYLTLNFPPQYLPSLAAVHPLYATFPP